MARSFSTRFSILAWLLTFGIVVPLAAQIVRSNLVDREIVLQHMTIHSVTRENLRILQAAVIP